MIKLIDYEKNDLSDSNHSGITLIALIITIIILLILSGITVSVVQMQGKDGLFERANVAVERWNNKVTEEETSLLNVISYLDTDLPTYEEGQEVTLGGEQFFVLEDQGENVKLLAKYCLNKAGTAQDNASISTYGRRLSRTKYWSAASPTYPCDLQSEDMITRAIADGDAATGIPSAVPAAINYGASKGAVLGRLMTNAESREIKTNGTDEMKKILYGTWTGEGATTDGYLRYWLGSASALSYIYVVAGDDLAYTGGHYNGSTDGSYGVRPVLIVDKTKIGQ